MRLTLIALVVAATGTFAAGEKVVTPIRAKEMQPGYGVVQSVTRVRVQRERSAAAGGSAGSAERARPMYRVAVRLPDGSLQYRDLDRPEFNVGDNVLLTNAGDILPD
jgi:hypothetical protein